MLKEEVLSDKKKYSNRGYKKLYHHWRFHTLPNQDYSRAITQQFLIGLTMSIANLSFFTQGSLASGGKADRDYGGLLPTSWRYKRFGIKDASFFHYDQILQIQNHF